MPKFSIIIPVKDNVEFTKKCLQSIKNYTTDYEIIIVDNGSVPKWFGSHFYGINKENEVEKIIRNEQNLGFPVAVNQGIKQALGDIIIILNNDTIVTPNWLDNLEVHLKTFDLVGPKSNYVSGPQKIDEITYNTPAGLNNFSQLIYDNNNGKITPYHRLVFFCVAIKKQVFEKIGFLDEQFTPGNFEDDDFCLRAVEAGFKLGIAHDVFIHHEGSKTHKSLNLDFHNLMVANLGKFQDKWPQGRYIQLQGMALDNYYSKEPRSPLNLALMMIVKNEEIGLERAILSVRHLVDEIVIAVDNSSNDKTLEIASKYATTLKHLEWSDDFSAARNFAMEGIKANWIMFLDGHEYLKEIGNLEEYLKTDREGLLTTIEMDTGATFRNPRIFRNGTKFVGAVHEQQQLKTMILAKDVIFKHDRLGAQSDSSIKDREIQRNYQLAEIMQKQLKKDKKNCRASFHLAMHAQGIKNNKQALKYQKIFLKYAKVADERWFVLYNRALIYLDQHKFFRAFSAVRAAEREVGGRWETKKLLGMIFFIEKEYLKAIDYFVDSLGTNKGDQIYKPVKKDDSDTWNKIGECFFNLKEYYKASVAFETAVKRCQNSDFGVLLKKRADFMLKLAEK